MTRALAACLAGLLAQTAPSTHAGGGLPITDAVLSRQWKAQWLTCPGAPARDEGVYRFRRVLELPAAPARFVVHVSGDQRFVLFANGQRVGIGPSRGDPSYWRFETFDLAPFLKPGRNLLVATVWNFGTQAPLAQVSDRTGFVLQADSETQAAVDTDATWECAVEAGHSSWAEGLAPLRAIHQYIVVGPGERLDAARYDWRWAQAPEPGKASGRWASALPYGSPSPRTIREGPGWALSPEGRWLVPDELPPMEYRSVPAGSIVRAIGLAKPPGFPDAPMAIPAHAKVTLLLDRKELVTAYPRLRFSGGRGARVQLSYQEALVGERGLKGNRGEIEGKRLVGLGDLVLPDGGAQRVFEPLWWRTWRFLEIEVETAEDPLTLDGLTVHATGYPFEQKARWDARDEGLARIWSTGWRTARLCAHETYVDCPYYEQMQYVGDTRLQALVSYTVAGDDRLARQAILAFDRSRRSDGLTSRYPTSAPQYIPPYSLLWVGMIHDFWWYRGDPAFVRGRLPGTRAVLEFYLDHLRSDGLVGYVPWWNFVDWAAGFAEGVPPLDADGGGSVPITLQMVNALREAADLEAAVGDSTRADLYRERASRSAEAVRRLAWDEAKGFVADTAAKAHFSQQANILAILADAVPVETQKTILDELLAEAMLSSRDGAGGGPPDEQSPHGGLGLTKASYYFRFYLARALEKLGRGDDYLPQLEPWREMLALGLSTWAETPDLAARSDCHAWNAHPTYDLLTIVAGIRPATPGFTRVRIEPHFGELRRLDASLPHPKGDIAVSYERTGDDLRATVTLPAGLEGDLVWRGKATPLRPGRQALALP